ncbi:hypothetical protein J3362_06650 [Marinobacter sp. NFXS11]|uniref:cyclic GMP-AMP synthase DncV-like nucleotidyltransferase n=1 Tax=Marinobacter sp. NFXS11 TaxID=2818432 RepID=UPI0032DE88A1
MFDSSNQISKYHNDQVNLPKAERDKMRSRRDANRKRLKKGLAKNQKPSPVGCHSQGSYAMWTMVQDANCDFDIDDGVYFEKADLVGRNGGVMTALQVRQMVCDALGTENNFSRPPELLKNCVRVYYKEGHHVDVPAYRRIATEDFLSGETTYEYELASADWKSSDPRAVTRWFTQVNQEMSPDPSSNGGQFRRVVRLLKKFARSRPSWKSSMASGFMLTKLAQEEFRASDGRDDNALRNTMKAISNRLSFNETVNHPVLSGETLTNDNDGRPAFLKKCLDENLAHLSVLDDQGCTHKEAMKAWDKVFKSDWFIHQPESGEAVKKASVFGVPTEAVDKRGGGRFA